MGLDADEDRRFVMVLWMLPGSDCYSSRGQVRSTVDWMSKLDRYRRSIL